MCFLLFESPNWAIIGPPHSSSPVADDLSSTALCFVVRNILICQYVSLMHISFSLPCGVKLVLFADYYVQTVSSDHLYAWWLEVSGHLFKELFVMAWLQLLLHDSEDDIWKLIKGALPWLAVLVCQLYLTFHQRLFLPFSSTALFIMAVPCLC